MATSREQRAVDTIIGSLERATAYIHNAVHRTESPGCPERWDDCVLGQCGDTRGALRSATRIAAGYDD